MTEGGRESEREMGWTCDSVTVDSWGIQSKTVIVSVWNRQHGEGLWHWSRLTTGMVFRCLCTVNAANETVLAETRQEQKPEGFSLGKLHVVSFLYLYSIQELVFQHLVLGYRIKQRSIFWGNARDCCVHCLPIGMISGWLKSYVNFLNLKCLLFFTRNVNEWGL